MTGITNTAELLRDAGYNSGNVLGPMTFASGANDATTSSTYNDYAINEVNPRFRWDALVPADVTMAAYLSVNIDPTTDRIDVRARNTTDGEDILEILDGMSGTNDTGPTAYEPTTTDSPIDIRIQHRNADNATTVSTLSSMLAFVPQL